MDYLIIFVLEIIGISLYVMQKIRELDALYDDDTPREVFILFWRTDWITLIISGLVLFANLLLHFILEYYASGITQIENYHLYAFGFSFVLGYAGQRLIYKFLGKAESVINKRLDDKLK